MKKIILLVMTTLLCHITTAQNKEKAEQLVEEGVAFHDKGDYEGAIARYDQALAADKDNLPALTEKAFSLNSLKKFEESVECCKKAVSLYPGNNMLKTVYVTYGNAYDGLNKTDKSLETYDEGIKQFNDFYLLHYNKGITLASVKKYNDAVHCFETAISCNPKHASSHNAIARLSKAQDKRIPSLLAYCRFLVLEPQSNRAKENLASVQALMIANVEETGKKSVTVYVSPDMVENDGKPKENDFASTDLLLSMDAALDFDKKNKKKTEVEQFLRKFENVCASLDETKNGKTGFYWDYYVPYFTEMKSKNLLEPFSYIAFASSGNDDVTKWLKQHESETDKFFEWSKSFDWKKN